MKLLTVIMWIRNIVLLCCILSACLAKEEKTTKKKDDTRGKRNLQYSISHHHNGPHNNFKLERRISTGPQPPIYHPPYFPGPRPYAPYHKGRPYSLPIPPYAVQMEPLVHYSQRDPLYDTNILSLNADGYGEFTKEDLLTDTNHLNENVYGPPQKHIIERPVYIKEPEPIIEIIIKESNVTLPPLPPPPTPPPKKKEQVQVFYVKYKKNQNEHGKENIVYDKPIPAISPHIPDEHEESPPQEYYHQEVATAPPPPSTTLRTVIRPESETYHGPSGIKVTFGKEGFDYDKRSNKPEDLKPEPARHQTVLFPQGRQLSSFPTNYNQRKPPSSNYNFQFPSGYRSEPVRQPQPYHPLNQFRSQPPSPPQFNSNNFPTQYSTLPKHLQFQQPQQPQFKVSQQNLPRPHSPAQFHQQQNLPQSRQPVPYQPFDNLKPQQSPQLPAVQSQIQFRPPSHFPINQQLPLQQNPTVFNQFAPQPQLQSLPNHQVQLPNPQQLNYNQNQRNHAQVPIANQQLPFKQTNQELFNNEGRFQNLPAVQQNHRFSPQPQSQFHQQEVFRKPQSQPIKHQPPQHQPSQYQPPQHQSLQHQPPPQQPPHQQLPHSQPILQHFPRQQQVQQQPPHQQFSHQQLPLQQQNNFVNNNEHLNNLQHAQNILPPGGELVQSLPKFEQHISVLEGQKPQALALQGQPNHQQLSQNDFNQKIQQQFQKANALQDSIRQPINSQYFDNQQIKNNPQLNTAPKLIYQTSTPSSTTSTTTQEPEKPPTSTKDPKVLNSKLPDEVPDDLREQLLSSGILNNADISILDYDKVGDIPLSALPPDQLANFYNAGGAQQIEAAGSEPISSELNEDGSEVDKIASEGNEDQETEASEIDEVQVKPEVQMKVVHYNPETVKGQKLQDAYVKNDATQVDPVVLNDDTYNRYLPLKVSGTQFPIPDVPELKGKRISSVVVLAPVTYDFSSNRKTRETKSDNDRLIQKESLKELVKNPTLDNYKQFLEDENKTRSDKQSVILLVTGPDGVNDEREIFMYDVATQTVNKLNGELSAAFVEAAEANASDQPAEIEEKSASNIIETRVPYPGKYTSQFSASEIDLENSASDFVEAKIPIIDPMQRDLDTEASEQLDSFVDISGRHTNDDLTAAASEIRSLDNHIIASSGYSKTGRSLPSV